MQLLQNGVDRTVIALLVGSRNQFETTDIYVHADIKMKEKAMAKTNPWPPPVADIGQAISCSPFWKHSDYADCRAGQLTLLLDTN